MGYRVYHYIISDITCINYLPTGCSRSYHFIWMKIAKLHSYIGKSHIATYTLGRWSYILKVRGSHHQTEVIFYCKIMCTFLFRCFKLKRGCSPLFPLPMCISVIMEHLVNEGQPYTLVTSYLAFSWWHYCQLWADLQLREFHDLLLQWVFKGTVKIWI